MSYIDSMEKALVYIESHLQDDIDLSSIAKEAGYSLYHFHRIFKGVVGDSIKDYIRKRRITEVFRSMGSITESVQKTWDYIYSIWLNESEYKHRNTDDIEYYFYNNGELAAELYIPIIMK